MSVEPVLGSALWQAIKNATKPDFRAVRTGCKSIDEPLNPGIAYGSGGICCISCETDAGGGEARRLSEPLLCCPDHELKYQKLSNAFLISHLLTTTNTATLIDTQGVNILTLFSTIKARLALRPHINPNLPARDLDAEAKAVLDRIRIMRVFSFEGLLEALTEFRIDCEDASRLYKDSGPSKGSFEREVQDLTGHGTLPDSQAASEDGELLFTDETAAPIEEQVAESEPAKKRSPLEEPHTLVKEQERPLLVISVLSSLLLPLQKTNYTHASALLSSLLRSLRHTTSTYGAACIIMNTTTSITANSFSPTKNQQPGSHEAGDRARTDLDAPPARTTKRPEPSPSIFASCTARPTFERLLASDPGVDLQLLVHSVPKTVGDAKRVYGGPPGTPDDGHDADRMAGKRGGRGQPVWVNCVEVIGDRYGGRLSRFGIFAIGVDGLVRDAMR